MSGQNGPKRWTWTYEDSEKERIMVTREVGVTLHYDAAEEAVAGEVEVEGEVL